MATSIPTPVTHASAPPMRRRIVEDLDEECVVGVADSPTETMKQQVAGQDDDWRRTLVVEESNEEDVLGLKDRELEMLRDDLAGETARKRKRVVTPEVSEDERVLQRLRLGNEEGENEGGVSVAAGSSSRVDTTAGRDDYDESDDETSRQKVGVDEDEDAYEPGEESDEDEDEDGEYLEQFGDRFGYEETKAAIGEKAFQGMLQAIEDDEEGALGDTRWGKGRNFHNSANFVWLPLGPKNGPKSFAKKQKGDIDDKHAQAHTYAVEYFQRQRDVAAKVEWTQTSGLEQPFCRKTLRIYKSAQWTADRLADLWLSGQSDYVRYLSGLPRPRTTSEHKAIPAPTSEQLQGTIIYSNLIESPDQEYRYGGSGTSRVGGGSRLWNYETLLKDFHNSPAHERVVSDLENHVSVMLRPDSTCHMRVILSWPREDILPDVAIVMEAAQVDLERYMHSALPNGSSDSYWVNFHSQWIRDHSYASFPESRTVGDFIGLNRAHPLRQGARCGPVKHRASICELINWVCSLCRLDKSQHGPSSFDKWRLAAEVFFPVEEAVAFCGNCVQAWGEVEVQDMSTALELLENPPRNKLGERRAQLNAQDGKCAYCLKPTRNAAPAKLEGFEGHTVCEDCRKGQKKFLEQNASPTDENISDFLTFREALAQKPERGPNYASEASKSCFACGSDVDVVFWLADLKGFENRRMCKKCRNGKNGDPKKWADIVDNPRAWLKWRMTWREDHPKKVVGYTSTGDGNGVQCPCCSGWDNLNGNSCELDDHEDIWACDGCVEAWPGSDEHTMSAWYEFAIDRKLASKGTIDERAIAAANGAAAKAAHEAAAEHVCKKCGRSFSQKSALTLHEKKNNCIKSSPVDLDMAEAIAANPDKWVCHKCGTDFATRDHLRKHFRTKPKSCKPQPSNSGPKTKPALNNEREADGSDSGVQESQPTRSTRSTRSTATNGSGSGMQRSQSTRSTRSTRSTAAAAKAQEQDINSAHEQERDDK
jgi:hypothetical protein